MVGGGGGFEAPVGGEFEALVGTGWGGGGGGGGVEAPVGGEFEAPVGGGEFEAPSQSLSGCKQTYSRHVH